MRMEATEEVIVKGKGSAADVDVDVDVDAELGGVWFVWRRRPQRKKRLGFGRGAESRALLASYR
jgi:hypothetical protein